MRPIDVNNFDMWLEEATQFVGAHSAASIRLDNPILQQAISKSNKDAAVWLQAGLHGEMEYLERQFADKCNPWETFPKAKSVIVIAFTNDWGNVAVAHPFPRPESGALVGYIAASARGVDYHTKGHSILTELSSLLGDNVSSTATVDTSPVNERLFATVGGLGEIGANSLLRVADSVASRTFIGCLFVDVVLPEVIHSPQVPSLCNSCCSCTNHCPTGALRNDNLIDARNCISYLTIEKGGLLLEHEVTAIGDWLYGCDFCTTSCPGTVNDDARIPIDLGWLFRTPARQVSKVLKGTATAYAGITKLRRNGVAVLKNMNTPASNELLQWIKENTGSELIRQQIALI